MKRDFSAPILDLDGEPVRPGLSTHALSMAIDASQPPADFLERLKKKIDELAGRPMTLGSVAVQALMAPYKDEEQLAGEERVSRMELARRLNRGGVVEIKPEDRDRIKPLVKKLFPGPLVYVTASELLEKDLPAGNP